MQLRRIFGLLPLSLIGIVLNAQDQPTQHKADNTVVNKRDRAKQEPTADQQKENASDRKLAKEIRGALMKDKTLSTYAHNVKVIAENGTVTLKGPVRSDEEKQAVEAKAAEVAGSSSNVRSELTVAAKAGTDHHASK